MKMCINSESESQTIKIGVEIGSRLKGGEIIELNSDLGGGKTTLVKGIVEGVGSEDSASSPSFTISNTYKSDALEIRHYDFYRISELGLMKDELQEVLDSNKTVIIIEWSGEAHDLLPKDRLIKITIKPVVDNENVRNLTFASSNNLNYLCDGIGA